ncbi:MAG: transcriptional regulator, MarR family [Pelosinus sp.]|nr:transcriptional regulator, MarR family [Pelosinus sp.]
MVKTPYIGKWISCLYRTGQSFFDYHLGSYGLGSGNGYYACFTYLFRHEGITQDTISKHVAIDKTTIARSIMKLETLGYVVRHIDPIDRRAYKVYLTEKGRALQPIIEATLTQWTTSLTHGLTPEETQMAYILLERMTQNAIITKEKLSSQELSRSEPNETTFINN